MPAPQPGSQAPESGTSCGKSEATEPGSPPAPDAGNGKAYAYRYLGEGASESPAQAVNAGAAQGPETAAQPSAPAEQAPKACACGEKGGEAESPAPGMPPAADAGQYGPVPYFAPHPGQPYMQQPQMQQMAGYPYMGQPQAMQPAQPQGGPQYAQGPEFAAGPSQDPRQRYQQPAFAGPSQPGQPSFAQPQHGQPAFAPQQFGQPQYGQPPQAQPQFGQKQYSQPQYGQPQAAPQAPFPHAPRAEVQAAPQGSPSEEPAQEQSHGGQGRSGSCAGHAAMPHGPAYGPVPPYMPHGVFGPAFMGAVPFAVPHTPYQGPAAGAQGNFDPYAFAAQFGGGDPREMEKRCGQIMDLCNDLMMGKTDPSKIMSFITSTGTHFWKGAIVGAALTFLLTNKAVKSTITDCVSGFIGGIKPGSAE